MTVNPTKTETDFDSGGGTGTSAATTVTLYLRSGPSGPADRRQRTVRDRFEALDLGDGEWSRTVERWARTVTTREGVTDEAAARLLTLYDRFDESVTRAGGRLEPFFQVRTRSSGLLVGGTEEEVVTFPVSCLAITRDDAVTGLYPCWLEGTHHSVEAGLDALAAGDPENLV